MFRIVFPASISAASLVAAASVATAAYAQTAERDWSGVVAATPSGGVIVGNPDAANKLVEYVSYTCSHCAHFAAESAAPLERGFVANGSTSFEIRPYLRNSVDYAISLAVNCGTPEQAYDNHAAVLAAQPDWLAKLQATPAQRQQQWYASDVVGGMTMIIADSGLQPLLATRGIDNKRLAACLADGAKLQAIVASTDYASQVTGVNATPSFSLNGRLLPETYDWAGVRAALTAAPATTAAPAAYP